MFKDTLRLVASVTVTETTQLDRLNRSTMHSSVRYYAIQSHLDQPEWNALTRVADEVRGKRILDLGVGGGRTVSALLELSRDYIGIDYVEEMTETCRRRFPGVRFETMDARSMPEFADGSFELIFFSCNGLCMVDHDGRMAILREVHRLLTPGGAFIFSAYNRNNMEHDRLFTFPVFEPTSRVTELPRRVGSFGLHTARRIFNRLRYKRREVYTPEYSIINDKCHDYKTMLYYTTMKQQLKQLQCVGFSPDVCVFNSAGDVVEPDDSERCDSLLYLVRR
jgi:SAM-dependent methyltransferase